MKNYSIHLLGKQFLVKVDEKLIKQEIKRLLKKRRSIKTEPKLKISTSFWGSGGRWTSPYDFKIFSTKPSLTIWLRSISIQAYLLMRRFVFLDKRPIGVMLEERYNFFIGHELGHVNDIKSPFKWFTQYLAFILIGGLVMTLLFWLLQLFLFKKAYPLIIFISSLVSFNIAYMLSPGERKATRYSREKFKLKPIRVHKA